MDAQVTENFHGTSMAIFTARMTDKLQRTAQRKVVAKQASALAKAVRQQLKQADMPWSRMRTRSSRRDVREKGIKPLVKTITTKTWNQRSRGILGKIVGARYPDGAQAHLVERGFEHPKSGRLTVAHRYQEKAEKQMEPQMRGIAIAAFRKWLRDQQAKGKIRVT